MWMNEYRSVSTSNQIWYKRKSKQGRHLREKFSSFSFFFLLQKMDMFVKVVYPKKHITASKTNNSLLQSPLCQFTDH